MALTIPNIFATKTGTIQLSLLDQNFTQVADSVNTLITDVSAINLLQLTQNATNLSGVGGVLDTLLPSGEVSGYVLTTTGIGQYQWAAQTSGIGSSVTPNTLTISTGLSGTSYNGTAAVTIALASNYGDTINPYASKTANTFLAAPNGTAGVPTFRSLVAADIPTLNQNTTGTAANLSNTGTVTLASAVESNTISITQPTYTTDKPVKLLNFDWYGNTWSLGNIRSSDTGSSGLGIFYGSSNTELGRFTANGWSGKASTATTATNLAGGAVGTIPYQSATGATVQLPAGTIGQVLTSNGAAAPTWVTPGASGTTTAGGLNNIQYFTTVGPTTYTPTTNTSFIVVQVVGGGGGGTTGTSATGGSGGGAGGYATKIIRSAFSGLTVTVGGGGAANSAGGTSSFGTLLSATGGLSNSLGGTGGGGISGTFNLIGGCGNRGTVAVSTLVPDGRGGGGGNGLFGGSGRGSTAGAPNTGSGGGGGSGTSVGGAGGSGIVIVWEYI